MFIFGARISPASTSSNSVAPKITAGGAHGLALRSDGSVWSFGANNAAQLGDGTTNDQTMAVQVMADASTLLVGITNIGAGADFSIALKNDGTVLGWGNNANGQLGTGDCISKNFPTQMQTTSGVLTNIIAVACGDHASYALYHLY